MSLGTMLSERLQHAEHAAQTVAVTDASHVATVELADSDRYSVTMYGLTVRGLVERGDAPTALATMAHALIDALPYLEEPLTLVEYDAAEGRAVLRSAQPQREARALHYWELVLDGGAAPTAQLARYTWTPGMVERALVAYPATFRLLARIADSMEHALASAL